MNDVRSVALAAVEAGICIVPPRQDGSKRPIGNWKQWQSSRPDVTQVRRWYTGGGKTGVGFICGAVSDNLELFEFDDAETYEQFKEAAQVLGLAELVERIEDGYLEQTPSGGYHWLTRCAEISGNTKLARRPKLPEEMKEPKDKVKVLIETRGEGGYVVAAPSNGSVHPSGGEYRLLRGGVETIPTITPDERAELWNLARTFDRMPEANPSQHSAVARERGDGGRPGDDFKRRATWEEILGPFGWEAVHEHGGTTLWRRPGTQSRWSASTNYRGSDLFYCWTTSTSFESERGYSKFAVYAILNHDGDFKAAAAELGKRGYGKSNAVGESVAYDSTGVMPFPTEVLPRAIRTLVEEGAKMLVAPPDLIAVPTLVAAGAVIGDTLEIELKPGWREGANLVAAVVADPGAKKTPASRLALDPTYRIQEKLDREYGKEARQYEDEFAAWEAESKSGRGPQPVPPTYQHVMTTDATTEALAPMLRDSKGLLLFKDEMTGWVRGMDQYHSGGRGADRQHFLSMWSRAPIKVDRKSKTVPIVVVRPHLSIFGGIQPDLLPELADAAGREDGFLDRLILSYPEKVHDRWTEDIVSPQVMKAYQDHFNRLYGLPAGEDESGLPVPRVIRLGDEAKSFWRGWYNEHSAETGREDFAPRLRGPWAKMPAQFARLTLILHALATDPVEDEVAKDTIVAAARLVAYFKEHARRVYRLLVRERQNLTTRILSALKSRGALTQSQLLRDVLKRNVKADTLRAELGALEEIGLVTRAIVSKPGAPDTTMWSLA